MVVMMFTEHNKCLGGSVKIEKLNKTEECVYVGCATAYDAFLKKATLKDIRKRIEQVSIIQDLIDLSLMVLDRRAMLLGDSGGHCPLPKRKAAQAMRLAFPKYKVSSLNLGS